MGFDPGKVLPWYGAAEDIFSGHPDHVRKLPIIGGAFGGDPTADAKQKAFEQNAAQLGQLSGDMDARRKAALQQSLGFFDPVGGLLDKMYGPGSSGPGFDIDALFGPSAQPQAGPTGPTAPPTPGNTTAYWENAPRERQLKEQTRNNSLKSQLKPGSSQYRKL